MELFGFSIRPNPKDQKEEENNKSFVQPTSLDGAHDVTPGSGMGYATFMDLGSTAKNQTALIMKYRQAELQPEVDKAIDDIVNEAIIMDENEAPVSINLDNLKESVGVKKKITEEFNYLMGLLDFNNNAYDTFRRWYVDGMIYFHKIVNVEKPDDGIKELRYIDPRKMKKVRNVKTKKDERTGVVTYLPPEEFFLFNPKGIDSNSQTHVKIAGDSITYVPSGLVDPKTNNVIGYLHKALKPINQLRMLEDATVIYRLSRAPERRIFYVDVGNLPKFKAEQHLKEMMTKHKNKIVYDAETGIVRDDRKMMTMTEDYWLPRREGNRGTEITTLPGGENLGEMTDVEYFMKQTLKALNVPVGRMDNETAFNVGRSSEISRDEVKFAKFVSRLRVKFSVLFDDIMFTQLKLKNVVSSKKQWQQIREKINYDFRIDNFYAELKETEINRERLSLANDIDPFVGKYVSMDYVRRHILRMTQEQIDAEDKQIKKEMEDSGDQFDVGGPGDPGGVAPHTHGKNDYDAPQAGDDGDQRENLEEKELSRALTNLVDKLAEDNEE